MVKKLLKKMDFEALNVKMDKAKVSCRHSHKILDKIDIYILNQTTTCTRTSSSP